LDSESRTIDHSLFIDDVNFIVGIYLFFYSLINPVTHIYYWTARKSGQSIIALLDQLGLCHHIERLEVDFSSPMPEGGGLWYWVETTLEGVSKTISQQFFEDGSFLDYLFDEIEPKRRFSALRKIIDQELYRPVTLFLLARRISAQSGGGGESAILVDAYYLCKHAKDALGEDAHNIEFLSILNFRNALWYWIIKFFVEQVLVMLRFLSAVFKGEKPHGAILENRIAIQYATGIQEDLRLNDLWWFRSSGISNGRLVLYFNRSRNKATDTIIAKLNEMGINYSILDDSANATSVETTNEYPFERIRWVWDDIASAFRVLSWVKKVPAPFWQAKQWFRIMFFVRQVQAFMKAENIKVIFDVSEIGLDITALAADLSEAIKIGTHWSELSYNCTRVTPLQHVYFVWGPQYWQIVERMDAASQPVLIGCVYDDLTARPEWIRRGGTHSRKLESVGAQFVIGVFDRSDSPNAHVPPPYHREFYTKLFNWAEQDATLGLLIKPKYKGIPRTVTSDPVLYQQMDALLQSGRAILLDGSHHVAEAGYGVDIVVALGINSGGLLCALQGIRTVFWDPTHTKNGPLSEQMTQTGWGNTSVVFEELNLLIEAIKQHRKNLPVSDDLGIFLAENLARVDSFRDGKAAIRVGEFVKTFLEATDQGMERSRAIDRSLEIYNAKWIE